MTRPDRIAIVGSLVRGAWRRPVWAGALLAVTLAGCVQPVTAVNPDKVYRSGQLTSTELQQACEDLRIKTIINLRQSASSAKREEALLAFNDTRVVHLPMDQNTPPTEEELDTFFAIMDDRLSYPVLIHCAHGKDRTGVMVAMYRIRYERWSPERAYKEMAQHGHNSWVYSNLRPFVLNADKVIQKLPRGSSKPPVAPVAQSTTRDASAETSDRAPESRARPPAEWAPMK